MKFLSATGAMMKLAWPLGLAALLLGLGAGGWLSWQLRGAQVARVKLEWAEERESRATSAFKSLSELHGEAEQAWTRLNEGLETAAAALAQKARAAADEERRLRKRQEELSNDPEFACRRRALPNDYLDRLRRPGPLPPT